MTGRAVVCYDERRKRGISMVTTKKRGSDRVICRDGRSVTIKPDWSGDMRSSVLCGRIGRLDDVVAWAHRQVRSTIPLVNVIAECREIAVEVLRLRAEATIAEEMADLLASMPDAGLPLVWPFDDGGDP